MRSLSGFFFLFAVSLAVVPSPARADRFDDALRLIDRGTKLMDLGDYRSALKLFAAAQTLMPDKPNPYRLLGLAHARLGDCTEAGANFDLFLKMVPPNDPRVAEVRNERVNCHEPSASDKVKPLTPTGGLAVETKPAGAAVRLDGAPQALGQTPYTAPEVPAGSHIVALSLQGFKDASQSVDVKAGETARLALTLTPLKSKRWVWVVVGVTVGVLAAAGVTTAVLLTRGRDEMTLPSIQVMR